MSNHPYDRSKHIVIEGVTVEPGCIQEYWDAPDYSLAVVTAEFLDDARPRFLKRDGRSILLPFGWVELIKYDPDEGAYLAERLTAG